MGTWLAQTWGMWSSLTYLCGHCRTFTSLDLRMGCGGACVRCGEPLPLEGRAQMIPERELHDVLACAPVPVLLVYWDGKPDGQSPASVQMESLARALSGELAVVLLDVAGDRGAADDQRARGAPAAVIVVRGKDVGRGPALPSEAELRAALQHATSPAALPLRREIRA